MYYFLGVFSVVFALTCAEGPRYHSFQKVEPAPYTFSGWRPSGPEFRLPVPQREYGPPREQYQSARAPSQEYLPPSPQQTYGAPQQEFGAPQEQYGPPQQEYGPPPQEYGAPPHEEPTTTVEPEITTTELPTTTESNDLEAEELRSGENTNESDKLVDKDEGVYYIYHPSGLLQRVMYVTKDDIEAMAFSANLKYENVEPVKGPIYTYDPKTFVFAKL